MLSIFARLNRRPSQRQRGEEGERPNDPLLSASTDGDRFFVHRSCLDCEWPQKAAGA